MLISGDPERITCIEDFPDGSLIGTASLRRQAQLSSFGCKEVKIEAIVRCVARGLPAI